MCPQSGFWGPSFSFWYPRSGFLYRSVFCALGPQSCLGESGNIRQNHTFGNHPLRIWVHRGRGDTPPNPNSDAPRKFTSEFWAPNLNKKLRIMRCEKVASSCEWLCEWSCKDFVLAAETPCEWKFATKFSSDCECNGLVLSVCNLCSHLQRCQMPDIENSRKTPEKGAEWVAVEHPKNSQRSSRNTRKTALLTVFPAVFRLFFGCFTGTLPGTHSAPFSAVFRLFSRSGVWTLCRSCRRPPDYSSNLCPPKNMTYMSF